MIGVFDDICAGDINFWLIILLCDHCFRVFRSRRSRGRPKTPKTTTLAITNAAFSYAHPFLHTLPIGHEAYVLHV